MKVEPKITERLRNNFRACVALAKADILAHRRDDKKKATSPSHRVFQFLAGYG
jgi:hypothetical protein